MSISFKATGKSLFHFPAHFTGLLAPLVQRPCAQEEVSVWSVMSWSGRFFRPSIVSGFIEGGHLFLNCVYLLCMLCPSVQQESGGALLPAMGAQDYTQVVSEKCPYLQSDPFGLHGMHAVF